MKYIVIISESASFPWGMAASSRVKLIAKGLIHKDYNVQYIGLRGAESEYSTNKKRKGEVEGVKYKYPGIFTTRSKIWVFRRIDDILGKWLSVLYIIKLKLHHKIDLIILYTRKYKVVKYWSIIAKTINIKIILEICEWPITRNYSTNAKLFCNKAPAIVDGVLPISIFIENEINKISIRESRQIPSYKIPILIDPGKFQKKCDLNTTLTSSYILYSGSLNYPIITNLILDIMVLLKKEGYRNKLVFTGGGNEEKYKKHLLDAKMKKIDDLIEFTGYLEEDVFIEKLLKASLLLAPIPNDLQTEARFPTKLGFYLTSGNPVITNPFGEVKYYLEDNKNVLFISEFNAEQFKEKIIYALNHREKCQRIGKNGKDLALKEFDYKHAFNCLNDFLKKL